VCGGVTHAEDEDDRHAPAIASLCSGRHLVCHRHCQGRCRRRMCSRHRAGDPCCCSTRDSRPAHLGCGVGCHCGLCQGRHCYCSGCLCRGPSRRPSKCHPECYHCLGVHCRRHLCLGCQRRLCCHRHCRSR
jgi:hypothetical protein